DARHRHQRRCDVRPDGGALGPGRTRLPDQAAGRGSIPGDAGRRARRDAGGGMNRRIEDARILVVDDEEANVDLLESMLGDEGYRNVVSTRDARQAVALYHSVSPDLVLLDLHMPHLDGFGVLREVRELTPAGAFVPVLVLTADITPEAKQRALS